MKTPCRDPSPPALDASSRPVRLMDGLFLAYVFFLTAGMVMAFREQRRGDEAKTAATAAKNASTSGGLRAIVGGER